MRKNSTITFQSVTETKDDGGSMVESWANVTGLVNVACIIDNVSSTERVIAEKNGHFVTHRIYMDYNSSITKDQRVVWNSDYYTITYLRNPNNLNRKLELDIYKHG